MSLRQHIAPIISGFVGATVAVSLLGGAAYAATGGTFLLGKANSASTTTTLTNSAGTALALASKAGAAPLKVNSSTKVSLLNVDKLDNLDSTQFARSTAAFGWVPADAPAVVDDWDLDNTNDSAFSIATCPAGTTIAGGGGVQDSATTAQAGATLYNGPGGNNDWVLQTEGTTSDPVAFAICFKAAGGTISGSIPTK